MTVVNFLDPAMDELQEAVEWYNRRDAGVGDELLTEVDHAVDQLVYDPTARPVVSRNVYRQPLDRFPFDLLYRILPERIEIVAVAHHSRKPGYWQRRH